MILDARLRRLFERLAGSVYRRLCATGNRHLLTWFEAPEAVVMIVARGEHADAFRALAYRLRMGGTE